MSVKVARVTRTRATEREPINKLQNCRMAGLQKGKVRRTLSLLLLLSATLQFCHPAMSLFLQVEAAEWRHHEPNRLLKAVRGDRFGLDAAAVADVTSAVDRGIAVEQLDVVAGLGHSDAVPRPRHRSEIEDHHQAIAPILRVAHD